MTVVLSHMVHIWSRQSRDMQGMFSVWSSFTAPPLKPKHLPSCPVIWAKQATFRKQNQNQLMLAKRSKSMGGEVKTERKWEEEKCKEQIAGEWSCNHHREAAPDLWMAKNNPREQVKFAQKMKTRLVASSHGHSMVVQAGASGWSGNQWKFILVWPQWKGKCFGASDRGHTLGDVCRGGYILEISDSEPTGMVLVDNCWCLTSQQCLSQEGCSNPWLSRRQIWSGSAELILSL